MSDNPATDVQSAWSALPNRDFVAVLSSVSLGAICADDLSPDALPLGEVSNFAPQAEYKHVGCIADQSKMPNCDPERTRVAPSFHRPKAGVQRDVLMCLASTSDVAE